jgi:hypothetical protein
MLPSIPALEIVSLISGVELEFSVSDFAKAAPEKTPPLNRAPIFKKSFLRMGLVFYIYSLIS